MQNIITLAIVICAGLVLSGCETIPQPVLHAYDACDRQTEACYDLCLLEKSRAEGAACDQSCDAEADRCFARVSETGYRNYPDWAPDSNFVFYGRTGAWSRQYGWQPGEHGRPYTFTRPGEGGSSYYSGRYYDPFYDDPNDCYGYRRAIWCRNRDWYRDRYRDKYWPDRRGEKRPDLIKPYPNKTKPKKPDAAKDKRPTRDKVMPRPVDDGPEDRRRRDWRLVPEPQVAPSDDAVNPGKRTFEPLIPNRTSRSKPDTPPKQERPVRKPTPKKANPAPRRQPSTSRPVRIEPIAPPPARPEPAPASKPTRRSAPKAKPKHSDSIENDD